MRWSVCLVAYAVVAVIVAPLLLTRGRWRLFRPAIALAAWKAAFGSGLAALALGLIGTVATAVHYSVMTAGPHTAYHGLRGVEATLVVVVAWIALGVVGGMASLVFTMAEPIEAGKREAYGQLARLVAADGRSIEPYEGVPVVCVPSRLPLATAVPGARPQIVVSSALCAALSPAELAAVTAHEHAHLRLKHARVAHLARMNALCLPWLAAAREFERATRLLIELIADDRSARRHGAEVLADALIVVAGLRDDESLLLRARRVRMNGAPPASRGSTRRAGVGAFPRLPSLLRMRAGHRHGIG